MAVTPLLSRPETQDITGVLFLSGPDERETNAIFQKIKAAVQEDFSISKKYWRFCCCLCPRSSRPGREGPVFSPQSLRQIFLKTIEAHIYRHSPLPVSITDVGGKFIDCNPSWLKYSGYSKEELHSQPQYQLLSPEDPQSAQVISESLEQDMVQYETRFQKKSGTSVWTRVIISALQDDHGTTRGYLTWLQDISLLKMQEEIFKQRVAERTRELEVACAEARSQVATNNHEMRTALTGVCGAAEILHEEPLLSQEKVREFHVALYHSSRHMLFLLNHTLDLVKLKEGHMQLETSEFSLILLLDEITKANTPRTEKKKQKLQLTSNVAPDVPKVLIGDPARIRQIVENIVGNSIKFTSKGVISTAVTLYDSAEEINDGAEAKHSPVKETPEQIYLKFEITDSGVGISPKMRNRLFVPFQQDRNEEGTTGLGLMVTKALVELMHGKMLPVQSPMTTTGGTRISFYIRVGQKTTPQESTATTPVTNIQIPLKAKLAGKKVLIVEDTPLSQKILSQRLMRMGMECDIASNGEEAIAKLQPGHGFDLVLMDVSMPVKDGLDATREIRQNPQLSTLPIIALTANPTEEEQCQQAGMNAFTTKPYIWDDLFHKMAKQLE